MLAEERVDHDRGADVAGGIDGADLDGVGAVPGKHLAQVVDLARINVSAGDRVVGDAAAELVDALGEPLDAALAHEVDVGVDDVGVARVLALVAHAGDQPGIGHAHLDEAADLAGERHVVIAAGGAFLEALAVEGDAAVGAADLEHHAERFDAGAGGGGGALVGVGQFRDGVSRGWRGIAEAGVARFGHSSCAAPPAPAWRVDGQG